MGSSFSKILKGICAVVVACVGIALTIFSGGTFALALGSGLFTAGIFGLAQVIFNKNVTWGQFFKSMCKGFAIGAVSGLCSIGASSMVSTIASATGLNSVVVAAGLGSLNGLVTNGLSNILHGKKFFDNWKTSMTFGAIIGASCQSLVLGTQSKEAVAGISKLREVITDFIPGAVKVAEVTGKVMKFLPNIQFSFEYMRAAWILGTDLLAIRRKEEVQTSSDQHLGVSQEVQQTTGSSTVPSGNPQTNSNETGNDNPGLIDTLKIIEQLTEEELNKLNEILAIQFAPPPPYDERVEHRDIEERVVNFDDVLDVGEDLEAVDLEVDTVENEMNVDHPEILKVERESNLNVHHQVADVVQDNQNQRHSQDTNLPAVDTVQNIRDSPEAQPAQPVTSTSFPGETGTQLTRQPIHVTVSTKSPFPSHRKHLANSERDIKRRTRGLVSPHGMIKNENSLFHCYKKQEELSALIKEEQKQRVLNNVTVEAGEGGERVGVRIGAGLPSTSASSGNQTTIKDNHSRPQEPQQISGEGFAPDASLQNRTISLPKDPKQAVVFKIAHHCEDKKEYIISQEWPEFDYNVRVVGVLGIPGSALFTMKRGMLMNMGYSITQKDAAVARLRMGINAYLLRNDRILIVECCDGIDFGSSDLPHLEGNENFNMGGTLLELLTFTLSSRILFSYPFHFGKPEEAAEYLISKFDLLVRMSSKYSLLTRKEIQIMLRTGPDSSRGVNSAADSLRRILSSQNEENTITPDLRHRLKDIIGLCALDAQILRNHEVSGVSISYSQESKRELQQLIQFLAAGKSSIEMNSSTLRRFTEELFEFMKKTELPKKLVEFQNSEVKRKNKSKVSDDIENYLNNVSDYCNAMLRSDTAYKHCGEQMIDYFKDFEKRLKEVEREPEEERSGKMNQMIIQHLIDIGNRLLTFASAHTGEAGLSERGIRLGLYGYIVFPQANLDNVSLNQASLRMGIETGLMGHLKNPIVHSNYRESWVLLALLARFGFRLRLLEFDYWTAIQPFLKVISGNDELPHDKLLVYSGILGFLREMTNGSALSFLPQKMNFWDEIDKSLSHQNIAQIGFDFEADAKDKIALVCERLLQDNSRCVEEHGKFVDLPLEWIENSIYAEKYYRAPQEQRDHLLKVLTHRNFEIMHICFAFQISKQVMKVLPEFCSCAYEYQDEGQEIMKHRLGIIANLAGSFKGNSMEIASLLKLNPVINFMNYLIDRGLVDRERVPAYFSQILNCCTHLVVAERNTDSLDPTELMPLLKELCAGQGDMDQIKEKIRNEGIIKYIGFTRYEFLKSGLVTVLIREFLQREMAFSDVEEYIIALMNFLVSSHDLDHLSADQYINWRQEICAKVLGHMRDSVELLNDEQQGVQQMQLALSEIQNCSCLLNRMIAIFHSPTAGCKGKFFHEDSEQADRRLESQNGQHLETVLREIFKLPHFKEDKYLDLVQEVVELMLNVASISGLSVADVLKKRRQEYIHGIGQARDTEVKVFQNTMDKLDISIKYEQDDRYVTVAAHIVAGDELGFAETRKILRGKVLKVQKYVKEQKENEEKRKKWMKEQEERRNQLPVQLVAVDANLLAERYREREKATMPRVFAVSDIFLVSGSIRISKSLSSDPAELIELLCQKYPADQKGAMLAHFLLFYNGLKQREEEIAAVVKYVQKVIQEEKFIALRREKGGAKKLLSLKHFETVLTQFGYKETDGLFELKTETPEEILAHFELFLNHLKNTNGHLIAALDSSFSPVPVDSLDTANALFPEAFFNGRGIDENLRRNMTTTSIKTLLQMRRENQKFPKQLEYTLVRIWKGTQCYQAVFRPQASLGQVIQSIVEAGIEFYELKEKSTGRRVDEGNISDSLSNFGFYFIELTDV